jgi:hypothetical protein
VDDPGRRAARGPALRQELAPAKAGGTLYKLLDNRVYRGEVAHKTNAYSGEHEPIITRDTWNKVQAVLAESAKARANRTRARTPALLRGLFGSGRQHIEASAPLGRTRQSRRQAPSALAVAVARAHRWQELIDDGRFASMSELANAVGVDFA